MTPTTERINEAVIDRRITYTVRNANDSDTHLKYAALSAGTVVGTYDGTTREIARQTKRSVSTVENWAHAAWLYREERKNGHCRRARELFRVLPTSHWWQAYDIHVSGYDAFYYLDSAEKNGWSGRDMMSEYRAERDAGIAPLKFNRAKHALRGLVAELLRQPKQLTNEQIEWLMIGQDLFTEAE